MLSSNRSQSAVLFTIDWQLTFKIRSGFEALGLFFGILLLGEEDASGRPGDSISCESSVVLSKME